MGPRSPKGICHQLCVTSAYMTGLRHSLPICKSRIGAASFLGKPWSSGKHYVEFCTGQFCVLCI